jgi:hypothetical protein
VVPEAHAAADVGVLCAFCESTPPLPLNLALVAAEGRDGLDTGVKGSEVVINQISVFMLSW